MEPYLGEIRVFAFNTIPRGWLACNGQTLNINTNQALFALLGTYYGGNGTTTFQLPNLQGKAIIGYGNYSGTIYQMGNTGGAENITLTAPQIPAHNHLVQTVDALGSQPLNNQDDYLAQVGVYTSNLQSPLYAVNGYAAQATSPVTLVPNSISTTGGSGAHENRMPFGAVNICICTSGIYPTRQ